ncbi:capsule assembly Wzi family protein [Vibrio genomosp. F6]|uniref:capsule assembly Wzi family protein n=1 Tax=Vibrio genomosp. F6 TaxID=723172 RepID=UPI0010BD7339|nr:capsule assembly Wzi family protein [Vibrio genomosp. F6]TKF23459.1 capsule assembly Wzi family protein [Vibrio genomosp. F6]
MQKYGWLRPSNLALTIAMLTSSSVFSSPWLESQDPFLRSSLLLLSDSGKISSPVNHYPARWSLFGDDLANLVPQNVQHDSSSIVVANQQLKHALQSAKLNRGNRRAKLVYGNEAKALGNSWGSSWNSASGSYGQFSRDEWGAYASYEHLDNDFAFRLSSGYSDYNGETEVVWDDSYLSLNAGSWLFSFGILDRWWGQGWQHNLILGSYAKSTPEFSVNYIGGDTLDNSSLLGIWSIETVLSKLDEADFDYHSANRFVAKPFSMFEFGITYQHWFDKLGEQGEGQFAVDGKLTLPHFSSLYHSVYTELASTSELSSVGAWLIGWSGSVEVAEHTARLVLESQQATSEQEKDQWKSGSQAIDYPSVNKQQYQNTYQLDDSVSAAIYLQLNNDHNMSVSYKKSTIDSDTIKVTQATYRLPALSGMVHFGVDYTQMKQDNETNIWTGYEFRF